mmetsp:Transcript_1105/g.2654  ORF Transcript_1105/g.2654 Transcript_1105/m.2654 type:complete len:96 (-) Transcript_1105:374-661(-)
MLLDMTTCQSDDNGGAFSNTSNQPMSSSILLSRFEHGLMILKEIQIPQLCLFVRLFDVPFNRSRSRGYNLIHPSTQEEGVRVHAAEALFLPPRQQ